MAQLINAYECSDELNDTEILMQAVVAFASELFKQADDDSMYHRDPQIVKQELLEGKTMCSCEEVAECILAWWGEL